MTIISFRLLSNLGNWREFLGKWFTATPGKKTARSPMWILISRSRIELEEDEHIFLEKCYLLKPGNDESFTVEPRLSGPRLSVLLDYPDFSSGPNVVMNIS